MDDIDDDRWEDDWQERAKEARAAAQRIAGLIAPEAENVGLAEVIAVTVVPTLQQAVLAAFCAEKPSSVIEKIQKGRKALAVLREVLSDPYVIMQISKDWPDDVPICVMRRLTTMLLGDGEALDRTFERSCDRIGGKKRDRVQINIHDQSSEGCCAVYAVILWRAVRSGPLKPGSQGLHRLCAALWRAAGGNNEPNWRHHIAAVLPFLNKAPAGDRDRARWWVQNAEHSVNELLCTYRQKDEDKD